MSMGQAVHEPCQPEDIARAMPRRPLQRNTQAGGTMGFGKGPCFGVDVVPSQTGKKAEIGNDFLLHIQTKSVFLVARYSRLGNIGIARHQINGSSIITHMGMVEKPKHTCYSRVS